MKLFEARRPATLDDVSWLRKALKRQLAELRLAADVTDDIVLAVAELAANAVVHADPPPTEIGVSAELEGIVLTVTISDNGAPFRGFAHLWERASLSPAAVAATSGRGMALARSSFDRLDYVPGPPNCVIGRRQLARRRPHVLVVEDEELLLETYVGLLEPYYRVLAATDLKTALALAQRTTVDLILTDFHLGSEPGTALVEALEDSSERPPIPIVMITGDPSVRVRALELGVDTFLTKPVLPEALLETVKLALTRANRQRVRLFQYFGASLEQLVRPDLPEKLGDFACALRYETADIGGGDLVVHLTGDGFERIVMADVMGHGINAKAGAVAHAAMIRALHASAPLGPDAFLERWSALIFSEPAFDAVTATALVVDLKAGGVVEVANAGHPKPAVISRDGVRAVDADGPLLGFTETAHYGTVHLVLEEGERLLLVTDGLDPADLAAGGMCPAWLLDELASRYAAPLAVTADRAATRIAARLGPDPQDDWTLVLVERPSPRRGAQAALPRMAAPEPTPAPAAPAAGPPSGGLDLNGVSALRAAVGEATFARLAGRFVENAEARFAQWEALVAAGDADALVPPAHALAGLMGQFGLAATSALARQVEHEADPMARLAAAGRLAGEGRAELAMLRAWLEKPSET